MSILRWFGPHLLAAKGTCAHCRLPDCHACEAEYDLQNGGKLMVLQSTGADGLPRLDNKKFGKPLLAEGHQLMPSLTFYRA